MRCPICGSDAFFVKSPQDEFETHEFRVAAGGRVVFAADAAEGAPEVGAATETFCCACAWHGKLGALREE